MGRNFLGKRKEHNQDQKHLVKHTEFSWFVSICSFVGHPPLAYRRSNANNRKA
jgi:hypothetical protein